MENSLFTVESFDNKMKVIIKELLNHRQLLESFFINLLKDKEGSIFLIDFLTRSQIDKASTFFKHFIKLWLSDQEFYVNISKEIFTFEDLVEIKRRIIGNGKIGGKAAGMHLAFKCIKKYEEDLKKYNFTINIPESWYLGSEVCRDFFTFNNLNKYTVFKYWSKHYRNENIKKLLNKIKRSEFRLKTVERVKKILKETGEVPLILRSSSLLEDNIGSSFAGKYDSFFFTNRGPLKKRVKKFLTLVKKIYISVFTIDAIEYRRLHNLLHEDEQMAILIQKVVGNEFEDKFFPLCAGVAFSQNPYVWTNKIKREDGMLRLVAGLGTHAVDREGRDFARLVALTNPTLRSEGTVDELVRKSQNYVEVINLNEENKEPVQIDYEKVIHSEDFIKIVEEYKDGFLMNAIGFLDDDKEYVLTFKNFLTNNKFSEFSKQVLKIIEFEYSRKTLIDNLQKEKWYIVGELFRENHISIETKELLKHNKYIENHENNPKIIEVNSLINLLNSIHNYFKFLENLKVCNDKIKLLVSSTLIKYAVDVEFAMKNATDFYILQCRPLAQRDEFIEVDIPEKIDENKLIFKLHTNVHNAHIKGKYLIYIKHEYFLEMDNSTKHKIARFIYYINDILANKYILFGPGRWGSSNIALGFPVTFAHISKCLSLIELGGLNNISVELSYGTHFYLDLIENNIVPIGIPLDLDNNFFNFDLVNNNEKDITKELFLKAPEEYKDLEKYFIIIKKEFDIYLSAMKNEGVAVFD